VLHIVAFVFVKRLTAKIVTREMTFLLFFWLLNFNQFNTACILFIVAVGDSQQ